MPLSQISEINNLIQGFTGSDSEIMYIVILDVDANAYLRQILRKRSFSRS